jgi:hypothetical protein
MARKKAPKGKRYPLNMRTTRELRDRIEAAAHASGRSLVQEVEYRLEQSFQRGEAEATQAALDDDKIDDYVVPLSEIGLWSPEYARIRQQGGHPPLPPEVARALSRAAKRAKITPEEYWKRKLRERGIDPDAPYMAPATESAAA